jgi:hypothetical protein
MDPAGRMAATVTWVGFEREMQVLERRVERGHALNNRVSLFRK